MCNIAEFSVFCYIFMLEIDRQFILYCEGKKLNYLSIFYMTRIEKQNFEKGVVKEAKNQGVCNCGFCCSVF